MHLERIINNVFSSNTYIIHDNSSSIAWLIDCGDTYPIIDYLSRNKLNLEYVFLTHTHYDHIYGLSRIMDAYPQCKVITSTFGLMALGNQRYNFSRYHQNIIEIKSPRVEIYDKNTPYYFSRTKSDRINIFETPGHDESCLTFRIGDYLFTGDSYIPGVKVIVSFPHSDRTKAEESYRLITDLINDMTIICPGHGEIVKQ